MKNKRSFSEPDKERYREKKAFFDKVFTIYGRKAVKEAISDPSLTIYRLHLSDSNKPAGILDTIQKLANQRGVETLFHDKRALSRISKNSKQDQGVALDILSEGHLPFEEYLKKSTGKERLIALDGITNPQNLGMIIRSVCAGNLDGIILPGEGSARISPLVIKASTGTVFKTMILKCNKLHDALSAFKKRGASILTLSSHAEHSLFEYRPQGSVIYVLGNETEGVSRAVTALSDRVLKIPMNNNVESLNVAVTASLIAFLAPSG